jgi:hypothetical protein
MPRDRKSKTYAKSSNFFWTRDTLKPMTQFNPTLLWYTLLFIYVLKKHRLKRLRGSTGTRKENEEPTYKTAEETSVPLK